MNNLSTIFRVYTRNKRRLVANIVLNGYNIERGGPLGQHGAMRSFKILRGELWEHWYSQEMLLLRDNVGREASIRVAALPVEEDGFGLIEFL